MSVEKIKTAGDDVDSRCLKCKDVTNHTIIAITGDIIAKVQCNTCKARHKYRPPVEEKKKKISTRRRRDGEVTVCKAEVSKARTVQTFKKKVARGVANFEALVKNKDVSSPIPYAMDATLTSGDVVDHSLFGLGLVMETRYPNKAFVTFREHGDKLMVCKLEGLN